MIIKPSLFIVIGFLLLSCHQSKEISEVNNFHKVNEELYRCGQPSKKDMQLIEQHGIKTVLNLRHKRSDKNELKGTGLIQKEVNINTWKISEEDLITALKIIDKSEKPIVVHCLHGADRTGAVIAAYRIVYDNWNKEKAIAELKETQYGFHEKAFKNIIILLENINEESFRKKI